MSAAASAVPPLRQRVGLGALAWLAFLALERPSPFDPEWPHALLVFAAFVLVPLGFELADGDGGLEHSASARLLAWAAAIQLPAAALLAGACTQPQGPLAAGLAIPWLVVTGLAAASGLARLLARGPGSLDHRVTAVGLVFLVVGGAWAVADRLGLRPLEFSPAIVLLTAVHFHFAGFVLPIAAGRAIREAGGPAATLAGWGVIAGVPAVAVGITTSRVGLATGIEAAAAWLMAAAGVLVAWLHLRLALRPGWPVLARGLWAFAGLCLIATMALAALYGSRFLAPPVRWLDIGWMQALHGAGNAFGFATAVLAGWSLAARRS